MNSIKFKPGDEIKVVGEYCNGYKGVIIALYSEFNIQVDLHTYPKGSSYPEKSKCCRIEHFKATELELVNSILINELAMKVLLMSSIK